ncbi:MAG: crossover junction endodeoxyribonuclease RuvC [Chloroflexaceae bacterium]|nr:crossover junction endodeoxyribonuclease RuvC [Chloroflexaceae bacterium]
MRTLGIDPGTALLGWGVLDEHHGTLQSVACGVVRTLREQTTEQRLLTLHTELTALVQQYQPDAAAIEELFFSRNVTTALAVGQARGVVLLTLAQAGIAVYEYTPREVKQAVAGYGGADKHQMQEMVRLTLNLKHLPRPDDAADALAIAICHAYTAPMRNRIRSASQNP